MVHAKGTSIDGIEGVLGVDEGGIAPGLLGVGDGVQGDRGLTGGLRTVDFDDATARQAADAEGDVESEGTRGDHLDGGTVIIPQAHDGALTELLVDLRQGDFERLFRSLVTVFAAGALRAAMVILSSAASPACGCPGLDDAPLRGAMTSMRPAIVICVPRAPSLWTTRAEPSSPISLDGTDVRYRADTPRPGANMAQARPRASSRAQRKGVVSALSALAREDRCR